MQKCFCTVYDYAGKADLNMGYWNPERILGAAGHFCGDNLLIIILKSKIQSNVWHFFFQTEALLSPRMHGYHQFSFWIPRALAKFCFFRIVLKCTKISLY